MHHATHHSTNYYNLPKPGLSLHNWLFGVLLCYMECQGAAASMDEGICNVWASTQSPTSTAQAVARVLGLKENEVVLKQRRAGGGFGGKLTRGIHVAASAALCAWKTGRNVKFTLDRNTDMKLTGGRHFCKSEFKVACDTVS